MITLKISQGRLNVVLKNAHDVQSGYEYITKSKMYKDNTWATKIEILATAKCFRRDVFTFLQLQVAETFIPQDFVY